RFEQIRKKLERPTNPAREYTILARNKDKLEGFPICPITRNPIRYPVLLDGIHYEEWVIYKLVLESGISPLTLEPRKLGDLKFDKELSRKIEAKVKELV